MSSSLTGKLEGSVEVEASAETFHDLIGNRPHHIPNACAQKVHAYELHEGEFGKPGSIVVIRYSFDGKPKMAKHLMEVVDPKTSTIRYNMLEGDLLDEYKSFVLTYSATPKANGKGSIVKWVLEYEKLHESIPDPQPLLDLLLEICQDMGTHLTAQP
ncbi:hypothetical protein COLO4_13132 [Corchorus olitorius]|uniref:Bet v I/Major latex protein domain-containing protein n=1 Tax=Corchorus olitorius TaxID=93759 RepID=A0A1R3JY14_9ROSI|nr:hypothetical protein COLO4_13132 [Corchorus olitorius]